MPLPSVPTAITVLNQNWDPNSEITTGNGSGGVKVGWEGDDDASYIVRLVYHPFSEDVILATINTGVGDKSAKIFGLLVTNFEYRIEIRAVNGDGVSATDEVEFTTGNPGDDLLDPTGLAVPSETITGATALLTWTDPNDAEYCYFVELSMGPLTTPIKIQVPLLESEMLLTGLVPGMTYSVRLRASGTGLDPDDNWVAPVEFTTPGATDAITGPALLPLRLGGAVGASFLFSGPGTVQNWGIAGAPSGVVIGVPLWAEDNSNIGALGGNVTASGVFDAEVSAAVVHEGALTLYSFLVRFLVSGGGFLAWLHGDPDRRDLQFSPRTGALTSFSSSPLRLKETEDFDFHVVFYDGARILNDYSPSELRLVIRMKDDFDGDPLLDIRVSAPASANLAGNYAWLLPIVVEGVEMERRFEALNAEPGGQQASASLAGHAQLMVQHAGSWKISRIIDVVIEQDLRA